MDYRTPMGRLQRVQVPEHHPLLHAAAEIQSIDMPVCLPSFRRMSNANKIPPRSMAQSSEAAQLVADAFPAAVYQGWTPGLSAPATAVFCLDDSGKVCAPSFPLVNQDCWLSDLHRPYYLSVPSNTLWHSLAALEASAGSGSVIITNMRYAKGRIYLNMF